MAKSGSELVITAEERQRIEVCYKEIRSKSSDKKWMVIHYNAEGKICLKSSGSDYTQFCEEFKENVVIYAYCCCECERDGKMVTEYVYCQWIGIKVTKKEHINGHDVYVKEILKERTCEIYYKEQKGGVTYTHFKKTVEEKGSVQKTVK